MNKYYSGIGARSTPTTLRPLINKIAIRLEELGYVLRSGGAEGADTWFEEKVNRKEIYVLDVKELYHFSAPAEASVIAAKYHPNWNACSDYAKRLHSRNVCQILGQHLYDESYYCPVDFVVCWTSDGAVSGGTGQAIRIAQDFGIPVFNLFFDNAVEELGKFVKSKEK